MNTMIVVIMCKYNQKNRKGKGFNTFFEKNAVYLQANKKRRKTSSKTIH